MPFFGRASLKEKKQYLWNDAEVVTNPAATQAKGSVSPLGADFDACSRILLVLQSLTKITDCRSL